MSVERLSYSPTIFREIYLKFCQSFGDVMHTFNVVHMTNCKLYKMDKTSQ